MNNKTVPNLSLIALITLLTGCGGTLVSKSFDEAQVSRGKPLDGIPFSLNRPKLLVTKTPTGDGTPESYVVTTAWEPDPSAHYVLQIRPGFFSSVDWTMTFDGNGALTDTSAKTTDQSATLVQAVGTLAAAGAAFFDLKVAPPALGTDCKDAYPSKDMPQVLEARTRVNDEIMRTGRIWDIEAGKWKTLTTAERTTKLAESTSFWNYRVRLSSCMGQLSSFIYADLNELSFIQTALQSYKEVPNPSTNDVDTIIKSLDASPEQRAIAYQLRRALLAYDVAAVQSIKASVLKARASLNAERSVNLDADLDSKLDAVDKELLLATNAADNGFPKPFMLAYRLTSIKAADWRSGRLVSLDKEIAQLDLLAGTPTSADDPPRLNPSSVTARLRDLRQKRAQLLGVSAEFRRRTALHDDLVAGMPEEKAKSAMTQVDYLDKRISAAETALIAAKVAPKAEDPVAASYLVSKCKLTSKQITDRLDARKPVGVLRDLRPDYVVVFNPPDARLQGACASFE